MQIGPQVLRLMATMTLCLAGCTLGNFHSIYRTFNTSDGQSRLVDAQQRSILVWHPSDSQTIVCAEPSPDALVAYAASLAAQGSYSGGSGSLDFSTIGSAASIGLRTQSIQLLRDAYYRACEAYASKEIDRETYDNLIRRLNNQAIAYLAIEQISSGAAAPQTHVAAPADLRPLYAKLDAAQEKLAKAKSAKKSADDALKANKDDKKSADLKAASEKADQTVKDAQSAANEASAAIAKAARPAAIGSSSTPGSPAVSDRAAEATETIALKIIEADFGPQMCFTHFRLNKEDDGDRLEGYCSSILQASLDSINARVKAWSTVEEALAGSIGKCAATTDANVYAKCVDRVLAHMERPDSNGSIMNLQNVSTGKLQAP